MTDRTSFSRRDLLRTGAVATGAAAIAAKSYANTPGANGRLNAGFIGCGGMAGSHIGSLLSMREEENVAVTAVCDVYRTRAIEFQERVAAQGGSAKVFTDHRELLAMDDIDYVVIATPEHSHHRLLRDALAAGKHVYCEKPLCHNIKEAKDAVARAKATGLKLQVGVQAMADDSYSSAHDAIREGLLGSVVQAQIDYVRNHGAERGPWRSAGTRGDMPKPVDLDWETWLSPRGTRPWDPHRYFEWRC
ncbi:MAG: Gfo/Idh/MocA family oxidoreductase, partial [Candidatus Hydrogenedentes bacterium]|nr:Gfo/Idh/MocA family oxidoreductase [Candidatus Hydrogenedentota bacterium]